MELYLIVTLVLAVGWAATAAAVFLDRRARARAWHGIAEERRRNHEAHSHRQ